MLYGFLLNLCFYGSYKSPCIKDTILYGTDFAFLSGLICISYIVGKGADINVNYGYGRGGRVLSGRRRGG